jgi:hypothetical protein
VELFLYTDWKLKSDECETAIDELKKQNDIAAAALAKLDRQLKLKVVFSTLESFSEYPLDNFNIYD